MHLHRTRSSSLLAFALVLSTCVYAQAVTPVVATVSSGVGGTTTTSVAQGGIITIFGSNLASAEADLSTYSGSGLPTALGNVSVSIGGAAAPLFMVSPNEITAQVPFETAAGQQPVIITSASAASAAFTVTVAATAPAWFSTLAEPSL